MMKKEQNLNTAETQALNIPVVMPSFLTHPYAQVVCTNKGELNYVLEWAKQNGKEVSEHYYKVEKFPYHLFLAGKIVGWTDSTNRVGDKFSFREFVDGVNWEGIDKCGDCIYYLTCNSESRDKQICDNYDNET